MLPKNSQTQYTQYHGQVHVQFVLTCIYWPRLKLLCGQQFVRVQQFALSWSSGGLEVLGIANTPHRFILIHDRRLCQVYHSVWSKDWPWGGCLQIHHNPSPMTWLELKFMMLPCASATTIYMITYDSYDPRCLQKAEDVLSSCNRRGNASHQTSYVLWQPKHVQDTADATKDTAMIFGSTTWCQLGVCCPKVHNRNVALRLRRTHWVHYFHLQKPTERTPKLLSFFFQPATNFYAKVF